MDIGFNLHMSIKQLHRAKSVYREGLTVDRQPEFNVGKGTVLPWLTVWPIPKWILLLLLSDPDDYFKASSNLK